MPLSTDETETGLMQCDGCGQGFDPVRHRWLCPWCGYKAHCCDGQPLETGSN